MQEAMIGIIGGSGLGDALLPHITDAQTVAMETPFGKTSGPLVTGRLGERQIVFLNRHGKGHKLNPSGLCVQCSMKSWARTLLASGRSVLRNTSSRATVIVDQFIDKTTGGWGRSTSTPPYTAS
jgi:5'-methylthioadenosine phosphorylase